MILDDEDPQTVEPRLRSARALGVHPGLVRWA
jgi:hypothetical protein